MFFNQGHLRQYFAAFSCQLSVMMMGTCFVWFTPLMVRLSRGYPMEMTSEESSWIVASIEIGELISPIPAGMLVNRLGRKWWLMTSFPLTLSSWIILVLTKSVEALYVVRFLQGMAMGIVFTVAPIYLAEISEPSIRGAICGNFQTFWVIGYLYAYITGPFLDYYTYAYVCAAQTLVFVGLFSIVPETPYYYAIKGRLKEAKESLVWLRGGRNVDRELDQVTASVAEEMAGGSSWRELVATPADRRTLLVVSAVCFVKCMSGMPAVCNYITDTVHRVAGSSVEPDHLTIVVGLVMLLATVVSAYTSDVLGRRPLVFLSMGGSIVFNAVAATYFYLHARQFPGIENYSWISYTSLTVYIIVNSVGISPLLQTLQGENFSAKNRGTGGAFVSFLGTIFTFIILKQYQTLLDWVGEYINYVTFSIFSMIGSAVLLAFMQETAGKSLGEIQKSKSEDKTNGIHAYSNGLAVENHEQRY